MCVIHSHSALLTPTDIAAEDPLEEDFRRRRTNALPGLGLHQRYLKNSAQNPSEEEEEHGLQSLTRGPPLHGWLISSTQRSHLKSRVLISAANCLLLCLMASQKTWRMLARLIGSCKHRGQRCSLGDSVLCRSNDQGSESTLGFPPWGQQVMHKSWTIICNTQALNVL